MHPAGVLAGGEQAADLGGAVDGEDHAAHHVMGGGHHLDQAADQVEAAVGAPFDHALEPGLHRVRVQVAHGQVKAAPGGGVAAVHFLVHGAADDVPRRPLGKAVVVGHEAPLRAVKQVPAKAAQAFFQHGAGHARLRPRHEAGGVELDHLHFPERQPGAQGHGHAVAALVAGRRVVLVHGGAAAGGEQHRPRLDEDETARPHVDHQHPGDGVPARSLDQLDGAVVLQAADVAGPHLLGQAVDDLDARQVALVHGAVEGLPGEGLLVDGAVGIAVEKAADLVLQLADALPGAGDQGPGKLLVVQPLAALDGVHEVALDGIAGRQGHVVAALDHARAAAFAEQALHRHGDGQIGRRRLGMKGGEKAGAAAAQDQDVGLQPPQPRTPMDARAAARRPAASRRTVS